MQLKRSIKWNPIAEQVVDDSEANGMLSRTPRSLQSLRSLRSLRCPRPGRPPHAFSTTCIPSQPVTHVPERLLPLSPVKTRSVMATKQGSAWLPVFYGFDFADACSAASDLLDRFRKPQVVSPDRFAIEMLHDRFADAIVVRFDDRVFGVFRTSRANEVSCAKLSQLAEYVNVSSISGIKSPPRCGGPELRSQIPNLRSQIPDLRSQISDLKSQIDPRLRDVLWQVGCDQAWLGKVGGGQVSGAAVEPDS